MIIICGKAEKIKKIVPLMRRLVFTAVPLVVPVDGFMGDFYEVLNSTGHLLADFNEPATLIDLDYEEHPLINRYKEFIVGPENSPGTVCGKAFIVLSLARVVQGALFPSSVF